LQYFNARWYDGSLGRWASPDSILPGGVQGYDRYAFVDNNPLRYTDPSGHEKVCIGYTSQGCSTWYETGSPTPAPTPSPESPTTYTAALPPLPPGGRPDARYYSVTFTAGATYWFWIYGVDVVVTDDELGVFQVYGTGPGYGGTSQSPFRWMKDMESTFASPQVGASFIRGNVYGTALQSSVESYKGPAKVEGGSLFVVSGERFYSADIETGGPNAEIRGSGWGPSFGPVNVEAHMAYVNAVYQPVFSSIARRIAIFLGWP
jgi:hypothetical protein